MERSRANFFEFHCSKYITHALTSLMDFRVCHWPGIKHFLLAIELLNNSIKLAKRANAKVIIKEGSLRVVVRP